MWKTQNTDYIILQPSKYTKVNTDIEKLPPFHVQNTHNRIIKLMMPQNNSGMKESLHGDRDSSTWPEREREKRH